MYGPTHLPNPRTPPLFPIPIPTCSQPDTRPPLPLSFYTKQAATHLPRWCWSGGWRRSGSAVVLCRPDGERGHAGHGAPWQLASPRARWPVCGLPHASSPLPRSAPPRHAGVAALDAPKSSCRHQFYLFSDTAHCSIGKPLTLLTVPLESDHIPELIMIHPSRPFFLLFTHALYLCENGASSELTRWDEDSH
jgi:hypothetical protein